MALYDALGRRVVTVHEGELSAGVHTLALDARGLAPGAYVLRATGEGWSASRRVVRVR
jgi:hypothetical protein